MIEPVTLDGWYELADGRVQRFHWRNGQLVDGDIVASWADVPTDDEDEWTTRDVVEADNG